MTALASPSRSGLLSPTDKRNIDRRQTVTTLTDAASITIDLNDSDHFEVTLGGNRTLANPSNATAGKSGFITVIQDGTGSRTLSYSANYEAAGGTFPTLSTGANDVDVLQYYVRDDDTVVIASVALNVS